jgi:hypothetical protein
VGDQFPRDEEGWAAMEIRAAELSADHLGRRIRLDYSNDDQTFVIARIGTSRSIKVRFKPPGCGWASLNEPAEPRYDPAERLHVVTGGAGRQQRRDHVT